MYLQFLDFTASRSFVLSPAFVVLLNFLNFLDFRDLVDFFSISDFRDCLLNSPFLLDRCGSTLAPDSSQAPGVPLPGAEGWMTNM